MDSHRASSPHPAESPLAAITGDTHRRFFHLPAEVQKRQEQQRQERQEKHQQRKAKRLLHMKTTYWKEHDRLTVPLSPAQSECLTAHARQTGKARTTLFRDAAFAFLEYREDGQEGRQEGEHEGQQEGQHERGQQGGQAGKQEGEQEGRQEGRQGGEQPGQDDRPPVTATPTAPTPDPSPPAAVVNEIRRLGVLLNQIARHVNTSKAVAVDELAACREIFTRIEERFGISQDDESPAEPQPATAQHPPDTAP